MYVKKEASSARLLASASNRSSSANWLVDFHFQLL